MDTTVAVIGTVFIDCKGFARGGYNPLGRNLGDIQFVHGGVGRNVAENLANLGLTAQFVGSVDKAGLGVEVRQRLEHCGLGVSYLVAADQCGMGMWLAVMNEKGDLAGSISQMPDLTVLEKLVEEKGAEIVSAVEHIVLELDLNANITKQVIALAQAEGKPVYGIPGNLAVIMAHPDVLASLDCFICNDIEAGRLVNLDFAKLSMEEKQAVLRRFVDRSSLKSMVITLGSQGSIYYDARSGASGYQPVFPVELVDSSGAGDAFFSGTVLGLVTGQPLQQAVIYGTKVAGWTIQSAENTCSDLQKRLQEDAVFQAVREACASLV